MLIKQCDICEKQEKGSNPTDIDEIFSGFKHDNVIDIIKGKLKFLNSGMGVCICPACQAIIKASLWEYYENIAKAIMPEIYSPKDGVNI